MKKIWKKHKILMFAVLAYMVLFAVNFDKGLLALGESKYYFIEMLEIMPPVLVLVAIIQMYLPTKVIVKYLGNKSGVHGIILAFAVGSLSAGPIYAAFPVCKTLLKKGASVGNVVIILSAWAVVKVPMLITEVKFMGFWYMAIRWGLTIATILIMSYIMNRRMNMDFSNDMEKLRGM